MNWRVLLAYWVIILAWGSAFTGIKTALGSYSPEHLVLLRLLIGSLGLIIFSIIKRVKWPDLRDIPMILLIGFLGFTVYHLALSFGEKTVSAGISSLLVSSTPIFSAILATIFGREKYSKIGWAGSFIAFFGVAFIAFGNGSSLSAYVLGVLCILIAALGESFYFVFQTGLLKKYGSFPFTIYTILAGTLFMLLFLPGLGHEIAHASFSSTLAVIYLGLVPTIIPYFAMAYITLKAGAVKATSSLYLTPAAALIISWIFLKEVPSFLALAGGCLTLAGVGMANLQFPKRNHKISSTHKKAGAPQ